MYKLTLFFYLIFLTTFLTDASFAESNQSSLQKSNQDFDYKAALQYSQDSIGKTIGDYTFIDITGKTIPLTEFRGKPLVISLIYTSCYHTCPMTTQHLARVVEIAQNALGVDSFSVATIGFDTLHDTPDAMRYFATKQDITLDNWYFFSANNDTIKSLIKDLGFIFFPSPRGYDHVVQATVIDANGEIYQQVYGEVFNTPLLVEPLKQLVLGQSKPEQPFLEDLISRVRFFCTTYDPNSDAYHFDYSIFVGLFIGASIILLTLFFLAREIWRKGVFKRK
ncbi:SCO family protein [Candidatus Parabeggiatoa sp. HSG14]|uniref:SCO family protein n=1 Tax=Candidatus Parabeggiatoa sp. HSG14 TaxID=3055593 RepID=UPI0025A87AD2|nr:SCO family protein [Thiotrichales bacterium HSG14]